MAPHQKERETGRLLIEAAKALKHLSGFMVVHFMQYGYTACMVHGPPGKWPPGNAWASDWEGVTCPACLAGREAIPTFEISKDGEAITCLRCKQTSHNQNDVENHYCGRCHAFHDDIWPPSRRWWLTHDNQGNPKP